MTHTGSRRKHSVEAERLYVAFELGSQHLDLELLRYSHWRRRATRSDEEAFADPVITGLLLVSLLNGSNEV